MRLAALFTGGKDSTYAARLSMKGENEVVHLVTVHSRREDSWMFHTVNIQLAEMVAKAFGINHITVPTEGEKERELDDLKKILGRLDVDGVVTGAIASTYQKSRIDHICRELGLEHRAPLWGRAGRALLEEMQSAGLTIIITSVAALGLDESWLGRVLDDRAVADLVRVNQRFGVDLCGEGGEFETLVSDAPWFHYRLKIVRASRSWDGLSGRYLVEDARLLPKIHDT